MRRNLAVSSLVGLTAFMLTQGVVAFAQPAQEAPLQPGEAFVTRFSGSAPGGAPGQSIIDPNGTVGSIIDLRSPQRPPQGQHWIDEPQRKPVTAGEVGQVFGVTLDDATPPNIYIAATSAFGLHVGADGQWMHGMWGPSGPGGIYKLDRSAGYRPVPFAQVALNGRQNTGAALGNIAFDRWTKQIFVSDLETGMIHRIRAADGADLGSFDHGVQGRQNFLDVEARQPKSLPPITFNPGTRALMTECPSRNFSSSPECWNIAESGRRVWGLGVMRNAASGELRLYYSVWSSPAFGNSAWEQAADEDKRNAIWSVRLGPDGGFAGEVRREFLLPDFFNNPQDISRAGFSQPVSDISFATCGNRPVMLLAERGGMRNLGLDAENAFATPHEARALRYEFDQQGGWRLLGRYDVGFYDRRQQGAPHLRANCSGGVAFGYGYNPKTHTINTAQPDQFVWTSGHMLCSPDAPCNLPGAAPQAPAPRVSARGRAPVQQVSAPQPGEPQGDESHVHGIQGVPEGAFDEVAPQAAFVQPTGAESYPSAGMNQAYLIDADINIGPDGQLNEAELTRNDATRIGDLAVYEICPTPALGFMPLAAIPVGIAGGHPPPISHAMYASHGRPMSHFRFGSHAPEFSHHRYGSHYRYWSHQRVGSHERRWSHNRLGSHERRQSHQRWASHERARSHYREGSHNPRLSHSRFQSHNPRLSHQRAGSSGHTAALSHRRAGSLQHNLRLSHQRAGSSTHNRAISQGPAVVHTRAMSGIKVHNRAISRAQTHSRAASAPPVVIKRQVVPRTQQIRRAPPQVQIRRVQPQQQLQIQRAPQRQFQMRGPGGPGGPGAGGFRRF